MHTLLKRIDVTSAFRVGIVLNALISAIAGLFVFGLPGLLFGSMLPMFEGMDSSFDMRMFSGMSLLSFGCFYVISVAFGAIFGGISYAVVAWLYNLAAKWVGGVRIELGTDGVDLLDDIERDLYGKGKRGSV
jgi:hypothetical protein